jgi:hypothetical protein
MTQFTHEAHEEARRAGLEGGGWRVEVGGWRPTTVVRVLPGPTARANKWRSWHTRARGGIQNGLDEGRLVCYLYTSVEGINITFAQSGPGYQPYFDAASQRFRLAVVRATSLKFFTLYKIEGSR